MKVAKIKTGEKFNNLTVLDIRSVVRGVTSPRKEIQLLCKCSFCGSEKWYPKSNVVNGKTKSCGCSKSKTKHGDWHTRLYGIWSGMKRRCYVTTCKMYQYYGARGIKICDEWKNDYLAFKEWALANGYSDKLTIDRIDVNGDYCPENCRWATYLTQQNNRRNNHYVEYQGITYTVAELARKAGISSSMLNGRLRKGEPIETAVECVDRRGCAHNRKNTKQYKAFGESRTMVEWAAYADVSEKVLRQKLYYFGSLEKALLHVKFCRFRDELKSRPDYSYKSIISFEMWLSRQQKM